MNAADKEERARVHNAIRARIRLIACVAAEQNLISEKDFVGATGAAQSQPGFVQMQPQGQLSWSSICISLSHWVAPIGWG